jgi:hypothetical protein
LLRASPQEETLLEALRLPAGLRRLRVTRSRGGEQLPARLVARIELLRPQLRQLQLSTLPAGWCCIGGQDAWDLH